MNSNKFRRKLTEAMACTVIVAMSSTGIAAEVTGNADNAVVTEVETVQQEAADNDAKAENTDQEQVEEKADGTGKAVAEGDIDLHDELTVTGENIVFTEDFNSADTTWEAANWGYQYSSTIEPDFSQGAAKFHVDFVDDCATFGYSKAGRVNIYNEAGIATVNNPGKATVDVYFEAGVATQGDLWVQFASKNDADVYNDVQVSLSEDEAVPVEGTNLVKQTLEFDLTGTAKGKIIQYALIAGAQGSNYAGDIIFDNLVVSDAAETQETVDNVVANWDFEDGVDGWYAGTNDDWGYQYTGEQPTVEAADGMLKFNVDYSHDGAVDWSQTAICLWNDDVLPLKGVNKAKFDFIYEADKLTQGAFKVKLYSNAGLDTSKDVDVENAVDLGNGLKKATVEIDFAGIAGNGNDFTICPIGYLTTYQGAIYIDNIELMRTEAKTSNVTATVKPNEDKVALSTNGSTLTTAVDSVDLSKSITLVDDKATDKTKAVYAYLKAMGDSKSVIYGHQNDVWKQAGSVGADSPFYNPNFKSDTLDAVGSISGVIGIDALSLTGNEYSASEHNAKFGTNFPETQQGNALAAADLTNKAIDEGAIYTLSAHMPNFKVVKDKGVKEVAPGTPAYEKYDFSGYTPGDFSGDIMNNILPGGEYNDVYNAYLDLIADYAANVNGPILFRPFHENTGSWFWWGKAFCDAETYKAVYRYTVDYLKDTKDVHNLIYVYGPGSEASNYDEYAERYPGNDYVDMVGFDMYHDEPAPGDSFMDSFKEQINVVQDFAKKNGKLFAVTETGMKTSAPDQGDNQTALHKEGNKVKDWHNQIIDIVSDSDASYYLVWANFGKHDGYYSPYVDSYTEDGFAQGHEIIDDFIKLYNDDKAVFAKTQKDVLADLDGKDITANATTTGAKGYITAPLGGVRVLEPTLIKANVQNVGDANVSFDVETKQGKFNLEAAKSGDTYTAELTADVLGQLGETDGTISLVVTDADGAKTIQTIKVFFNMPEPAVDPLVVDGFENYLGVDALLTKNWATQNAGGSTINISLSQDYKYQGDYSMKFAYNETSDGWAGATIAKSVDWSSCNAVQFWTKPDGNNQKVVFQIVAGGDRYEVHLQEYADYCNTTDAMLVTIPFSEFKKIDNANKPGQLVDNLDKVEKVGVWLNAIADTPAAESGKVAGTIYYDQITAVTTDLTEAKFDKNYATEVPDEPIVTPTPSAPDDDDDDIVNNGSSSSSNTSSNSNNSVDNSTATTNNDTNAKNDAILEFSKQFKSINGVSSVEALANAVGGAEKIAIDKIFTNGIKQASANAVAVTITSNGQKVKMLEPATLTMKLANDYKVTNANNITIAKIEKQVDGTYKVKPIGGEFEAIGRTVTAKITEDGIYTVVEKENLNVINLQIGKPTVKVNGITKQTDVAPTTIKDTTMVPLRFIGETLNAKVEWNHLTKTVKITKDGKTLSLKGENLVNGRVLVPLRYISENFGANVSWVQSTHEIIIAE